MRKTNFLILLCLFMASQMFAQQTKSFAEHWFGINPQNKVQKSTAATPKKAPAKVKSRTVGADGIITLDLSKSLNPETFTYTEDGYWTETYNEEDYMFIDFEHFSFSHLIDGDSWGGTSWDGFTVCTSGDNANYNDEYGWDFAKQWGNMAGGGIKTDENGVVLKDENGKVLVEQGIPYMVAYWGFGYFMDDFGDYYLQTILTDEDVPFEAVGVYVNASPWAYYSHIEGDGYAKAFEEGDYFKLLIHGLDENYEDNGTVVEYILAEFTDGALHQSPDWEWIDLSSLGEVYGFRYSMETTDNDLEWGGPKTATYFCLDKLQVRVKDEVAPTAPTNLKGEPTETTIALSWTESTDNVGVAGYIVYVDGVFVATVTGTTYTAIELTASTEYFIEVEAFDAQGNVSEKASVTVTTTDGTGINNVGETTFIVYQNSDNIIVNTIGNGIATVYNVEGKVMLSATLTNGNNCINTSMLSQGIYILKYNEKVVKIVK